MTTRNTLQEKQRETFQTREEKGITEERKRRANRERASTRKKGERSCNSENHTGHSQERVHTNKNDTIQYRSDEL